MRIRYVMILVSFVELLQGSIESVGFLSAHMAFFLGMASIFLIDFLAPHEYIGQHDRPVGRSEGGLMRVGLLVAFGSILPSHLPYAASALGRVPFN